MLSFKLSMFSYWIGGGGVIIEITKTIPLFMWLSIVQQTFYGVIIIFGYVNDNNGKWIYFNILCDM